MVDPYYRGQTLDDIMRLILGGIRQHGEWINPSKGGCQELTGVLIELTNPRARISRTETRGKPFSCLGELSWYLAKTNDLAFISYYIPQYRESADGDIIFGGYGPRLFNWDGVNQIANVAALLKTKPDSRQAVIQLFNPNDIVDRHSDVPCTCTIQFMIRRKKLHVLTSMRSNDVIVGLPHDIFCFTMLQEIMARVLSVEVGHYKHMVGSLHLYDTDKDAADQFLSEGWQSTDMSMPAMPIGDPWPSIDIMLKAEAILRTKGSIDLIDLKNLDPYWADLIRLLQVFRCWKNKDMSQIRELDEKMSSSIYRPFIDKRLSQLSEALPLPLGNKSNRQIENLS